MGMTPIGTTNKKLSQASSIILQPGETVEQFVARVPTKPEREKIRKGAFLIVDGVLPGNIIGNTNTVKSIKELVLLNPSHIAGLQGLWAELAIRDAARVGTGRSSGNQNPNRNTTRYNKNGKILDYVEFKAGRYEASRFSGISPFNFVFKNFVENTRAPWNPPAVTGQATGGPRPPPELRDAQVTCFEKVRVDWNWVKLWAGAPLETLDWNALVNGTLVKAHSLPSPEACRELWAGSTPPRPGGLLTAADIKHLRAGHPHIFGSTINNSVQGKMAKLRAFMTRIFKWELNEFAPPEAKGDKSGEQDGKFTKAVYGANGAFKGYIVVDDELKISTGLSETYPGEEIQLLKSLINNFLFLNCTWPGGNKNEFMIKTESYFVAFGVGALSAKVQHKSIFDGPGASVAEPRKSNLGWIAREARAIFGETHQNRQNTWDVPIVIPSYTGEPANVNTRKKNLQTNAFPGCNFAAIATAVRLKRVDYDNKLAKFFADISDNRVVNIILDDEAFKSYIELLLMNDEDKRNVNFSAIRGTYTNLAWYLRDAFADYLHGYKKKAFVNRLGSNGEEKWRALHGRFGRIRPGASNKTGRTEDHFIKLGLGAPAGFAPTATHINNSANTANRIKIYINAIQKFRKAALDAMALALANAPNKNTRLTETKELMDASMNQSEINTIVAFMRGGNRSTNAKYLRAGTLNAENNAGNRAPKNARPSAGNAGLMAGAVAAQEEARRLGAALLRAGVPVNGFSNEMDNFANMPLNFLQEGSGEAPNAPMPNAAARVLNARTRVRRSPSPGERRGSRNRSRSRTR
jgi:hypothetical protein